MDVTSQKTSVFFWRLIAIGLVCLIWIISNSTPSAHATPVNSKAVKINVTNLYALNVNSTAVYRYNGTGTSWTQIGGSASVIYGGGYGLFATNPTTGNIYRYNGVPGKWTKVGGPGVTFAVTDDALYGVSPWDHQIWKYSGMGTTWIPVGMHASYIYAGGYGLFEREEGDGELYRYNGTGSSWTRIGSNLYDYVVSDDTVYGCSFTDVIQYTGSGSQWSQIKDTQVEGLYSGGYGTFILDKGANELFRYGGTPGNWLQAGPVDFSRLAVSDIAAYGMRTGVNDGVWKYSGSGTQWIKIGYPASYITVGK